MSVHLSNGYAASTNGHAASTAAPAAPAKEGRDARGRFTAGNLGGPGNPFARRVAALRTALLKAVTEADIDAIARQLVEQAKAGDVPACKLLFAYVLGKPAPAPNPDDLDWQELQQRFNCPPLPEAMAKIQDHYRPEVLVIVNRLMDVIQRQELSARLNEECDRAKAARPKGVPSPAARRNAAILQRGFLNAVGARPRKKRGGRQEAEENERG